MNLWRVLSIKIVVFYEKRKMAKKWDTKLTVPEAPYEISTVLLIVFTFFQISNHISNQYYCYLSASISCSFNRHFYFFTPLKPIWIYKACGWQLQQICKIRKQLHGCIKPPLLNYKSDGNTYKHFYEELNFTHARIWQVQ